MKRVFWAVLIAIALSLPAGLLALINGNQIKEWGTVIKGAGTADYVPRFTDGVTLGTGLIHDSGNTVGIGTANTITNSGGLDIASGGIGLIIGADDAAKGTRTDLTTKRARIGFPSHLNASNPCAFFNAKSEHDATTVCFGGGTASFMAATRLSWYTATDTQTDVGTERMRIDGANVYLLGLTGNGLLKTTGGTGLLATGLADEVDVETTLKTISFGITIDGAGTAITTGSKGYVTIPYTCTPSKWTLLADQAGAINIRVKKADYATFPTMSDITGTETPIIAATNQKAQDAALTTWTGITAGDTVEFYVNSCATITRVNLVIEGVKQ